MSKTFILINKQAGEYNQANPITEDDLFEVTGEGGGSGDLNFIEGSNIVISKSGNNITISSTASGEGADGNNYTTDAVFNTSTGIFTIKRNGLPDITESLDGRYLTSLPAHNHDDRYYTETESDAKFAAKSHTHNYEPAFTKNSAFNKNFGTGNNDVARGNHHHRSEVFGYYVPSLNLTNTHIGEWLVFGDPKDIGSSSSTAVQSSVTMDIASLSLHGEWEGSVNSNWTVEFTALAGQDIQVPEGFTTKISPGGVFGIKKIGNTQVVLFGTLIPE